MGRVRHLHCWRADCCSCDLESRRGIRMFERPAARESGATRREIHGLKSEDLSAPYHRTGRTLIGDGRQSPEPQRQRGGNSMADTNNGPAEAVKGVVEDVKGKAKEFVGSVAGRGDLVSEGEAQQDKAQAQRDAAKREAEAEAARGSAKVAEERQKSHQ
jgi:uncharacterized protein YjbJ (UPF0337 family)